MNPAHEPLARRAVSLFATPIQKLIYIVLSCLANFPPPNTWRKFMFYTHRFHLDIPSDVETVMKFIRWSAFACLSLMFVGLFGASHLPPLHNDRPARPHGRTVATHWPLLWWTVWTTLHTLCVRLSHGVLRSERRLAGQAWLASQIPPEDPRSSGGFRLLYKILLPGEFLREE